MGQSGDLAGLSVSPALSHEEIQSLWQHPAPLVMPGITFESERSCPCLPFQVPGASPVVVSKRTFGDRDDESAADACGASKRRNAGQARVCGKEEEESLFVDALCGQLDELRRGLEFAHLKVQADRATIAELQRERDLLCVQVGELQAAGGENASAESVRQPGTSVASTPREASSEPSGERDAGKQPREAAAKGKQLAQKNDSVIVLDSDDEMAEQEPGCDGRPPPEAAAGASEEAERHAQGHDAGGSSSSTTRPTEDDELVFVSSTGELGGDLPHPRNLCPLHKFWAAGDNLENIPAEKEAQNRSYCDNCYCYLCDVLSCKCATWSTGSNWLSHCNAHAGIKVCKVRDSHV